MVRFTCNSFVNGLVRLCRDVWMFVWRWIMMNVVLWCNFSMNWIVRIVWHLLVIIYVKCIYVVGEYIRIFMYICCCWWIYTYVDVYMLLLVIGMLVWTCEICMKHILLWSSPSSHTLLLLLLLLFFISNCSCWILRYSLCGLLCGLLWRVYKRQGRRPRRWKKFGTTLSRVI